MFLASIILAYGSEVYLLPISAKYVKYVWESGGNSITLSCNGPSKSTKIDNSLP